MRMIVRRVFRSPHLNNNCKCLVFCKHSLKTGFTFVLMKPVILVILTVVSVFVVSVFGVTRHNVKPKRVICAADTLLVYQDCKMCVCKKPNQPAQCFRKSCDLRTKDGGMCPPAVLKMDDYNLCQNGGVPPLNFTGMDGFNQNNHFVGSCKTDSDCPGIQFCCFDFCQGAKCMNPVPLEGVGVGIGVKHHPGRGYP